MTRFLLLAFEFVSRAIKSANKIGESLASSSWEQGRNEPFSIDAGIAKYIVAACAEFFADVVAALVVQPVNSAVLDMTELWVRRGWNNDKLVGSSLWTSCATTG